MRKGLVLATLVLGGATAAEAQIIDMSAIYPGPLALTHTLLATDGRHYSFSGDTVSGVWSRSIDPGYIDYHVWEPDGMYYMGWLTPGELHWAAPPSFAFPRFWDQAPWTRTAPYTLAHRTAAGDTIASYDLTISLRRVVIKEERLIHIRGTSADETESEDWWVSECIPVRGGGCSSGFRGFTMKAGGVVTGEAEFVEWVPIVVAH